MSAELPRRLGRFVLLEQLASGGIGDIYLARLAEPDAAWPEAFVVKVLKEELAGNAEQVLRFRHEAELGARIASPHWPKVLDAGAAPDGELFIAMEHISGKSLGELARAKPLEATAAVRVLLDYLEGLHAIHAAVDPETRRPLGLVHRDLSPRNLLVDERGRGKLIDLGLSRSAVQDWKTRAGGPAAEAKYAAPEVRDGVGAVDHRADLYSLAMVMREAMNGAAIPAALAAVLDKASAVRANDRWLSAEEMRDAVAGVELELARTERPQIIESELPTQAKTRPGVPVAEDPENDPTPLVTPRAIEVVRGPRAVVRVAKPAGSSRLMTAAVVAAAMVCAITGTVIVMRGPPAPREVLQPPAEEVAPRAKVEPHAGVELAEPEPEREERVETQRVAAKPAPKKKPALAAPAKVTIDPLDLELQGSNAAVAFAELTNDLVERAEKLADAKERDAIKSLATASGVARDIGGMKRAIARLKSAEEKERSAK